MAETTGGQQQPAAGGMNNDMLRAILAALSGLGSAVSQNQGPAAASNQFNQNLIAATNYKQLLEMLRGGSKLSVDEKGVNLKIDANSEMLKQLSGIDRRAELGGVGWNQGFQYPWQRNPELANWGPSAPAAPQQPATPPAVPEVPANPSSSPLADLGLVGLTPRDIGSAVALTQREEEMKQRRAMEFMDLAERRAARQESRDLAQAKFRLDMAKEARQILKDSDTRTEKRKLYDELGDTNLSFEEFVWLSGNADYGGFTALRKFDPELADQLGFTGYLLAFKDENSRAYLDYRLEEERMGRTPDSRLDWAIRLRRASSTNVNVYGNAVSRARGGKVGGGQGEFWTPEFYTKLQEEVLGKENVQWGIQEDQVGTYTSDYWTVFKNKLDTAFGAENITEEAREDRMIYKIKLEDGTIETLEVPNPKFKIAPKRRTGAK